MNYSKYKTVVVKVGTSTLTYENGKPNFKIISSLCKTLCDISNMGMRVVLVSSGAISLGVSKLGLSARPTQISEKQATAAVGQCELMHIYDKEFGEFGNKIAQVLLTKDIFENEERKANAFNTFEKLFEYGVIPIVNENDSVSIDELVYGDNDTLSSMVSILVNADLLVLLSDVNGLYDKNPSTSSDAKLILKVEKVTPEIQALASESGTNRGTGGMITKLYAAKIANKSGIKMAIANGKNPQCIYDILNDKGEYTLFLADKEI